MVIKCLFSDHEILELHKEMYRERLPILNELYMSSNLNTTHQNTKQTLTKEKLKAEAKKRLMSEKNYRLSGKNSRYKRKKITNH